MSIKTTLAITATLSVSALLAPTASANDLELVSTTIPASACQPVNDEDDGLLRLRNGSFMFRGDEIGEASLLCPLPLNGWRVTRDEVDQFYDEPKMSMRTYRIYYRDENTCQSSHGVSARLRYRGMIGNTSTNASPWWDSWSLPPNSGDFCIPDTVNDQAREVEVRHTLRGDRLYHFLVRIYRGSTAVDPVFTGIDFPSSFEPIP